MKKQTKIVPATGRALVPEIVLRAENQGNRDKLKAYGDYIDRYLIPNWDYESGIRGTVPGVPS